MKRAWLLLLSSGCIEASPLEVNAPAQVEYVALLDTAGGVISGSELAPWPKGQGLPILGRQSADALIVGYSAQELRGAGALDKDGTLATGRVRLARSCEPALPVPSWASRWTAGGVLEDFDAATLPPLSTTGLADSCVELDVSTISVDLDCLDLPCESYLVEKVDRCGLSIDLSSCGDRLVFGRLQPNGGVCLDRTAAEQDSCEARASFPVARPPFSLLRKKIGDAPATMPDFLRFNELLLPDFLFFGSIYDLAIVEGRLWVAAGTSARDVCRGNADLAGSLVMLDLETLELVATATVPPCLTRIAASSADRAVAVFVENEAWTLGQLDGDGVLGLREVLEAPVSTHRLVDLEVLPESNAVAVLFNIAAEDGKTGDGGNILLVHALDDLRERQKVTWPRGQRWAMTPSGGPGLLAIADHHERRLEWWHVETGTAAPALVLPRRDGFVYDDSLLDVVSFEGEVWVHATRNPLVMIAEERGALLDRDYFYEQKIDPVTSARWTTGQDRLLVSGTATDGTLHRAYVSIYDRAERRFLPGTFELGAGIAAKMIPGPGGRVFALLPWAGEIVRVDPAN
jgi:hypothetical protein